MPPLPASGAGYAHVGDPTLIDVHGDDDERAGRKLDDERTSAEIELDRPVRRIGVIREPDMPRLAVQYAEDLVVDDAGVGVPAEDGGARHRRIEKPVGLERRGSGRPRRTDVDSHPAEEIPAAPASRLLRVLPAAAGPSISLPWFRSDRSQGGGECGR